MNFLSQYVKGIAIGAGAILPGISSGVLCVIFGIYDQLIDSILEFFHNVKLNLSFLAPILLGVITGVILFANLLFYVFALFPIPTSFTVIGVILGSVPLLFKRVHKEYSFHTSYLFYLFSSVLISVLLFILEKQINYDTTNPSFFYFILCGFCMSIGVVVPGVSSTAILICLGIYPIYLASVSSLYLPVLIPMGIGLMLGGFLFLKLIQFLLQHYFVQTYYAIIGFVVASMLMMYPGFTFDGSHLLGIFCMWIGFQIATFLEK